MVFLHKHEGEEEQLQYGQGTHLLSDIDVCPTCKQYLHNSCMPFLTGQVERSSANLHS